MIASSADMRITVKKQLRNSSPGKRGGKRCFAAKIVKKGKKKSKSLTGDWLHLTKADADVLVQLINKPFRPNQALKEAEELYSSIPQLG